MWNNIKFSIVIPTYKRANTIKRCLDSLIAQTYSNWEAIIVDNFSEDGTDEIVKSYGDERLKYFKNHNYGIISVSRNYAIDRAIGDWICFLDSDDCWDSTKLECLLPYINDYDIIYHGYKTNSKSINPFHKNKELFYTVKDPKVGYLLQRGDPLNPSCTAVSKNFVGSLRFSEDKKLFAIEDYDFFLQLMLLHPQIYHLKKYLTFYDSSTGVSHDNGKSLDRTRVILIKYKEYLTSKEWRNTLKLYLFNRGYKNLINGNHSQARKCFLGSMSSPVYKVKKLSVGCFIVSVIKQIMCHF